MARPQGADDLLPIADVLESDPEFSHPFYKALWYWHEVEARIAAWRARMPAVRVVDFETQWLNDLGRVCHLLDGLGVQYEKARLAPLVGAKSTPRIIRKSGLRSRRRKRIRRRPASRNSSSTWKRSRRNRSELASESAGIRGSCHV